MELSDINHLGGDNMPGLVQEVWFAQLSDIDTTQFPTTTETDPLSATGSLADLATITGNVVMKEGKDFHKIYVSQNRGSLSHEVQGGSDSKNMLATLEFFHPGTKAAVLGFYRWAMNNNLVFIVIEKDGTKRLFGTPGDPAKISGGSTPNGPEPSGEKGNIFTFQCVNPGPVPIFTGKVDLQGSGYNSGDPDDFQTIYN